MERYKSSPMMAQMKKSMRPRGPMGPIGTRARIEPESEPVSNMPRPPRPAMPTPEEEARMRSQVEDERMMRRMGEAYENAPRESMGTMGRAKGGKIGYAKGGSVGSASKRADGIAQRGKTKGTII